MVTLDETSIELEHSKSPLFNSLAASFQKEIPEVKLVDSKRIIHITGKEINFNKEDKKSDLIMELAIFQIKNTNKIIPFYSIQFIPNNTKASENVSVSFTFPVIINMTYSIQKVVGLVSNDHKLLCQDGLTLSNKTIQAHENMVRWIDNLKNSNRLPKEFSPTKTLSFSDVRYTNPEGILNILSGLASVARYALIVTDQFVYGLQVSLYSFNAPSMFKNLLQKITSHVKLVKFDGTRSDKEILKEYLIPYMKNLVNKELYSN